MNVKDMIKKSNINFKERKLNFLTYLIFENETILVLIKSNKNIFKITRDDFNDLEQELLDYDFCLIDDSKNQLYYMKIKEPNNFIRKAFDSTTKNEIYFGKEILQNKITEDDLKKEEEDIQKLTDKKVEEIDMLLEKKEKEIMSI